MDPKNLVGLDPRIDVARLGYFYEGVAGDRNRNHGNS